LPPIKIAHFDFTLNPNSTGAEFAAVVRTMPMADQQAIEAAVDRLLKERDQ
jgi:hypothetical protein